MKSNEQLIISITDTKDGLEVRINEGAYGNLAIVGVLEKLKHTLITYDAPEQEAEHTASKVISINTPKYDA